jgi:hypothetical protein
MRRFTPRNVCHMRTNKYYWRVYFRCSEICANYIFMRRPGERNLDPTATLSSHPLSPLVAPRGCRQKDRATPVKGAAGSCGFAFPCSGVEVYCCAGPVASLSGVSVALHGVCACVCALLPGWACLAGAVACATGSNVLGAARS